MKLKKGLLALGVVILAAATGSAQEPARSGAVDSRMVVIPMRSVAEVTADIDNATMVKEMAAAQKAQAEGRLKEIELTIEQKQTALKDVDRRKGEAKKGQRQSEVIALDIEKKVEQQAIDLLKRLKEAGGERVPEPSEVGKIIQRAIDQNLAEVVEHARKTVREMNEQSQAAQQQLTQIVRDSADTAAGAAISLAEHLKQLQQAVTNMNEVLGQLDGKQVVIQTAERPRRRWRWFASRTDDTQ